jgi:hypothetical protein
MKAKAQRHATTARRGIVTDISTPRNLVGRRIKFIVAEELGSEFSLALLNGGLL